MEQKQNAEVKKGNHSWRPHRTLNVRKKADGKRLRWVNTDPANIEKKQAEGWVFSQTEDTAHDRPKGVDHGKQVGSLKQYRDLVLMEMPEDMAVARNEYYSDVTKRQSAGVTKQVKDKIGQELPGATVYGEVKIS